MSSDTYQMCWAMKHKYGLSFCQRYNLIRPLHHLKIKYFALSSRLVEWKDPLPFLKPAFSTKTEQSFSGVFLSLSSKTNACSRQDLYNSEQYGFCSHALLQHKIKVPQRAFKMENGFIKGSKDTLKILLPNIFENLNKVSKPSPVVRSSSGWLRVFTDPPPACFNLAQWQTLWDWLWSLVSSSLLFRPQIVV